MSEVKFKFYFLKFIASINIIDTTIKFIILLHIDNKYPNCQLDEEIDECNLRKFLIPSGNLFCVIVYLSSVLIFVGTDRKEPAFLASWLFINSFSILFLTIIFFSYVTVLTHIHVTSHYLLHVICLPFTFSLIIIALSWFAVQKQMAILKRKSEFKRRIRNNIRRIENVYEFINESELDDRSQDYLQNDNNDTLHNLNSFRDSSNRIQLQTIQTREIVITQSQNVTEIVNIDQDDNPPSYNCVVNYNNRLPSYNSCQDIKTKFLS